MIKLTVTTVMPQEIFGQSLLNQEFTLINDSAAIIDHGVLGIVDKDGVRTTFAPGYWVKAVAIDE